MLPETSENEGKPVSPVRHRTSRSAFLFLVILVAAFFSALFFVHRGIEYSRGGEADVVVFTVEEGQDVRMLADRLREAEIIGSEWSFLLHLLREGSWRRIQAGDYLVSGTMPIPEIVRRFVHGETVGQGIKVTFPEGMTAEEMSDRLSKAGLDGDGFLAAVRSPGVGLRTDYLFLSDLPPSATLEGFLFPDTYFFDPLGGAAGILRKMLDGFESKADPLLSERSGRERYQALVLASVLETEVRTSDDRRLVADLFLRRIEAGMPLQSDATVRYALGETKVKHSLDDLAVDSPYNTYRYPGLPPGPISNPGVVSIEAVLHPLANPYWYFLNNPETGETVFAETFEEHVANKKSNGL